MSNRPSVQEILKEYGRGSIGGLLFSLPLIYTMEVWWSGFTTPSWYLIVFILVTYCLLLGYNTYVGMRKDSSFWEVCRDSVEEIGLAFIVSFLFLLLIRQISFGMSFEEIAGKVIVESMVVAIGISVGTAQLGQEDDGEDSGMDANKGKTGNKHRKKDSFFKVVILSFCGAVLLASAVAPTQEILQIAVEINTIHLLLMVLLSLFLCFVILYYSDFLGSRNVKLSMDKMLLYICVAYLAALIVSFFFLWFFGRIQNYSFQTVLSQIIVLSIPGSLGAAAGRLLLSK